MKKQILFVAMFTLALIFAGTSSVFGQLLPGVTISTGTQPIPPLSCVATSEPLHPFPGVPYLYEMDGTAGEEKADQWTWFATKNPAFITAPNVLSSDSLNAGVAGELLEASDNYGKTAGTNSVTITWSSEILANTVYQGAAGEPTFVVGYATGTACADNIQVYEINPRFNFTIDIANIDPATNGTLNWDTPTEQCVDVVQSATYNTTSKEIDMDYGKDTLYFEVAAANFVTDWTPTFRLVSGLVGAQIAEFGLASSLADAQAGTFIAGSTFNWTAASVGADFATTTPLTATNPSDVVSGVSAYVRVIISNLTEESLTTNTFELAVDAIDNGGAGVWDMELDIDCDPATATDAADQLDSAIHNVRPRPQIDHATIDAGLPAPTTVITKTP